MQAVEQLRSQSKALGELIASAQYHPITITDWKTNQVTVGPFSDSKQRSPGTTATTYTNLVIKNGSEPTKTVTRTVTKDGSRKERNYRAVTEEAETNEYLKS